MTKTNLCVSIPVELESFCKNKNNPKILISKVPNIATNFGMKLFKKDNGEIQYAAYFSDTGTLVKKVFYEGFKIVSVEHFRNNCLHTKEIFDSEKLIGKTVFDKNGNVLSEVKYEYNRQSKICSVEKIIGSEKYSVEYGYDDLGRVSRRKISVNNEFISEQKYRFDILDRVVNYSDENQNVKVLQISPKNELIYYKITDKMDNEISIVNHYDYSGYQYTDVTLNGHTISIKDRSYVDNIMLKKPYTTEDDLDLIISRMFSSKTSDEYTTKRIRKTEDSMIDSCIQNRTLPISIRKRLLYNISLNAS